MEQLRKIWNEGGPLAWIVALVLLLVVIGCFEESARRAIPCLHLHVFVEEQRTLMGHRALDHDRLLKEDTADGRAYRAWHTADRAVRKVCGNR